MILIPVFHYGVPGRQFPKGLPESQGPWLVSGVWCSQVLFFVFFSEFSLTALYIQNVFTVIVERREQVPFSMAVENGELMHECSPTHLCMGTILEFSCHQRRNNFGTYWRNLGIFIVA